MKRITIATLIAASLTATGCPRKKSTKVVEPGDDTGAADRSSGKRTDRSDGGSKTTVTADDGDGMPQLSAIYFEFDSSELTAEAREELQELAAWLESHPDAQIEIEGHTDDRGTDEYNIGLGERRAKAIETYLGRLGVDQAQLATISYGEERPAASGDDESAWSRNRRGELVPDR